MKYTLVLLLAVLGLNLPAQELSWKEHQKLAETMQSSGKYAQAADNYEMAWNQKPSKMGLLASAADAYRLNRDYRKAAELYKLLLEDSDAELAGLYYGRMLKQLGDYQLARTTLENFSNTYSGDDPATLKKIVQQEIRGCGLAQQWSKKETDESSLKILSELNTKQQEFAPLPFADDILYFSSTQDGKAKILRSQKKGNTFSEPVVPNLPRTPGGHFCHGTFTPDNERFYFTVCNGNEDWAGNQAKCKLYVTMRENNGWSVPQSMRDYVMMDGTTVTHPFVYHDGDTEILYFVSDRSGGKGGLDIWYMTRQIAGKDIDFTYPVNAGPQINTIGDEVTPFYNQIDGKMYFSSNGHVSIGGFDIFMAEGKENSWAAPKNLELPYNSNADDYYFVQLPTSQGAYLVSNRITRQKENTTDDDLFFLGTPDTDEQKALVSGKIFDKTGNTILKEVEVSIYEKLDNGQKRLLTSKVFADGQYEFPILSDRMFIIEANKNGFAETTFEFSTLEGIEENPGKDLFLQQASVATTLPKSTATPPLTASTSTPSTSNLPVTTSTTSTTASTEVKTTVNPRPSTATTTPIASSSNTVRNTTTNTGTSYTPTSSPLSTSSTISKPSVTTTNTTNYQPKTYTNSRYKNDGVTTSAPKHDGEYFKVQLAVVIDYDLERGSFLKMQEMGRLDTEYIISMGWTRVLLADFFSLEEARRIMDKARLKGYPEAFIVRYVDGYRKN